MKPILEKHTQCAIMISQIYQCCEDYMKKNNFLVLLLISGGCFAYENTSLENKMEHENTDPLQLTMATTSPLTDRDLLIGNVEDVTPFKLAMVTGNLDIMCELIGSLPSIGHSEGGYNSFGNPSFSQHYGDLSAILGASSEETIRVKWLYEKANAGDLRGEVLTNKEAKSIMNIAIKNKNLIVARLLLDRYSWESSDILSFLLKERVMVDLRKGGEILSLFLSALSREHLIEFCEYKKEKGEVITAEAAEVMLQKLESYMRYPLTGYSFEQEFLLSKIEKSRNGNEKYLFASMDNLPNEIVAMIFKYLNISSRIELIFLYSNRDLDKGELEKIEEDEWNEYIPINVRDENGLTMLHKLCYYGHKNKVNFLLEKGALKNMEDKEKKTPLWYAKEGAIIERFIDEKGNKCVRVNKKSIEWIEDLKNKGLN